MLTHFSDLSDYRNGHTGSIYFLVSLLSSLVVAPELLVQGYDGW